MDRLQQQQVFSQCLFDYSNHVGQQGDMPTKMMLLLYYYLIKLLLVLQLFKKYIFQENTYLK
jgi:hypothetical protein